MAVQLKSVITCPNCGHDVKIEMEVLTTMGNREIVLDVDARYKHICKTPANKGVSQ